MSYIEAYHSRLERNQEDLLKLAEEVVELDNTVEVYVHKAWQNRLIQGIVFFKKDNINSIHFHEVPFRWSGCGYRETPENRSHKGGDNVAMPFTALEVIDTFSPVTKIINRQPNIYFKSKADYLKGYSFYTQYKP